MKSAPRSDGLHVTLADHMSTVTFKLALSDEEKRVMMLFALVIFFRVCVRALAGL